MNQGIIIEKADNTRRRLNKGYKWQRYLVHCIRTISEDDFALHFQNRRRDMEEAEVKWEDAIKAYINRRCNELGLHVEGIVGHLVEEPNENKLVEAQIWKARQAAFVWVAFGIVQGPIEEKLWQEMPLPLFSFWPSEISHFGGAPEVVDATQLSRKEQGICP
jgi:hypothetical protein